MNQAPFVPVARVVKAHGLKGEVSVAPVAGLPFVLREGLEVWFVPPPEHVRSAKVASIRSGPKGPLVTFDGVSEPAAAHALAGTQVMVRTADVPLDMAEEPFDPMGLAVVDEMHGHLGEIVDVIETGANDVWVVQGDRGEVLVPVIDDVVLDIDTTEGEVTVRLLPGLLAEEAEEA